MTRPPPDPAAVVALFERKHYDGATFAELVEWSATQPWGPIAQSTAHAWYKRGCEWWAEHMRLSPDEEYAGLRTGLDVVASDVRKAFLSGEIDVKTYAELAVKVAAEIRTLTGAARSTADSGQSLQPPDAALDEMAKMRARRLAELEQRGT